MQPSNLHDRSLFERVHPTDWAPPIPASRYNLVVLGAGTAGLVAAAGAAKLGARVALVEKHLMGGDCLNTGCVPSKALLRSARAAAALRQAPQFGIADAPEANVDFTRVIERMRRLRATLSPNDSAQRFRDLGVDVFFGHGRFTAPDTLQVDRHTLRFAKAVIATGARAALPAIPGLASAPCLTNDSLFSLSELPRRLAIIGAGPIGCEMAQCFARLGSRIILVESTHGILPREERDAARLVQTALEHDGVQLLCCSRDLAVSCTSASTKLRLHSHDERHEIEADQVLVATGRTPNLENLGLETAGVLSGPQGLRINDRLQTTNPDIYVCGDVCSSQQFTHAADFMARIVIRNALFCGRARFSSLQIPHCTYTSPELARIGPTPAEAASAGIRIDSYTQALDHVDRAVLDDNTDGFVRIHTRRGSDRIVGATLVAPHAGDLISEIALAMKARIGLKTLADTIHPYPTLAEAIRRTGDLYNQTRLTPWIRSALNRWLAWRR